MSDATRSGAVTGRPNSGLGWAVATAAASAVVTVLVFAAIGGAVSTGIAAAVHAPDRLTVLATGGVYLWMVVVPVAIGAGVTVGIGLPAAALADSAIAGRSPRAFLGRCGAAGIAGAAVLWPFAALSGVVAATWTARLVDGATADSASRIIMRVLRSVDDWSFGYTLLTAVLGALAPVFLPRRTGVSNNRILAATAALFAVCAVVFAAHATYLNRPVAPESVESIPAVRN
ncbi:hypothetical protein [Nocardia sp. NPDC050718]|uniref:hypothetical protein n=1 Tax=Nocardia sp. NPDC050718 TaxID=3155788 RepID=UPI0033F9D019